MPNLELLTFTKLPAAENGEFEVLFDSTLGERQRGPKSSSMALEN